MLLTPFETADSFYVLSFLFLLEIEVEDMRPQLQQGISTILMSRLVAVNISRFEDLPYDGFWSFKVAVVVIDSKLLVNIRTPDVRFLLYCVGDVVLSAGLNSADGDVVAQLVLEEDLSRRPLLDHALVSTELTG